MNIRIIILDKIGNKFTKEAIAEYGKRLSKYCKLTLKECKNEVQLTKELEDKSYIIYVNSKGTLFSSEEMAEKFSELALKGRSDITFIVAANTLSQHLLDKVDFTLAISRMDIDFGVLLVILYEQIYRAYRINSNEPYHK
jgi:23S rRNA (pseudouridine1915-N3)-methyltransferase